MDARVEINAQTGEKTVIPLTPEEIAARPAPVPWSREPLLKVVKAGREIAMNRLMGIAGRKARQGDAALADICDVLAERLLVLTKQPAVLAATDDASLIAAVSAEYAAITAATPDSIKNVFAGIQT